MSLTKLTEDVENHAKQDDEPNDVGGLLAPALKAIFDKAAVDIKTYLNDTLTDEVDSALSSKVSKSGDKMTGALELPYLSYSGPCLKVTDVNGNEYVSLATEDVMGTFTGAILKVQDVSESGGDTLYLDLKEATFKEDIYVKGKIYIGASKTEFTLEDLWAAMENKVSAVAGKDLSTNDYTNDDKTKLTEMSGVVAKTKIVFEPYSIDVSDVGNLPADKNLIHFYESTDQITWVENNDFTFEVNVVTPGADYSGSGVYGKVYWLEENTDLDNYIAGKTKPALDSVTASSNTYTLDLSKGEDFKCETTDAVAKTIAISNVPSNTVATATLKLKYTNAAAITHPTGTVWKDGVIPTFTAGKTYLVMYISYDNGTSWLASSVGAW